MPNSENVINNLNKKELNSQNNNTLINKNSTMHHKKPIVRDNDENVNKKNILSDSDSLSSSEDSGIIIIFNS